MLPDAETPALPWPTGALFPFASRFVDVAGNRIHYVDEGSGPVLLFLHPAPATSFMYREFIAGLRGRFRCVALDYPGFGLSRAGNRFGHSLEEYAGTVAGFEAALGLEAVTLVLHDAGGPIGLRAAGMAPDRHRGFVLSDTFGFPLRGFRLVRAVLRFVSTSPTARALNRRFNLLPRLVSTVAPVRRRLPADVRRTYRALFPTRESRDRILDLLRQLAWGDDFLARTEQGILHDLRSRPALLMYGQFDPVRLLGFMRRFEALFPDHRSRVIPWEGHFPHEGSPTRMIAEIGAWMDSLETNEDVEAYPLRRAAHAAHHDRVPLPRQP
jgi:haloalkane dehalogenase